MNSLQLWSFGALALIALIFVGSLIWAHFGTAIKGFRWDYRRAPEHEVAEAPLIAIVASMFMDLPFVVKDIVKLAGKALWNDVLPALLAFALLLTSPVTFWVIAWASRRSASRTALLRKKRDLKERAYA